MGVHGGLVLPPRRRRGPAWTRLGHRLGLPHRGPGLGRETSPQAGCRGRKRGSGWPGRQPGRAGPGGSRRGGDGFGGGSRGGSWSRGLRWRGRADGGEDARGSPREPRFCKSWSLTYGNDARAGPHSRPFEGRPPRASAPPAKYCPASCALTKRPPSLCRAVEAGGRLCGRNGEADRR